ncbi:MAG: flagellar hook-associated protein FlgK [Planctomycetota bacterium]
MSLYGSIQMATNSLRADQIAMQVIGQNISNANTPGYIREETILTPGPTQNVGHVLMGSGVQVDAVVQKIDLFLEGRLRGSVSERASSETQQETYVQLEGLIGELTDTDLSTSLDSFFSAIQGILNDPGGDPARGGNPARLQTVLEGVSLTTEINRLARRVGEMRAELDKRVQDVADRINRLTEEIKTLNIRIVRAEGGDVTASDAVGLRDQRLQALENLAELVDIDVREQPSGGVVVYAGGNFLVSEGVQRPVEAVLDTDRGLTVAEIHLADSDALVETNGGELHGLITARDDILGGFLDDLDAFAGTLAFEFNKIYSGGQGLSGFQELTSEFSVDNDVALDEAGLQFTPVNGSFQVLVQNTESGLTKTTDVFVDFNGIGDDTTLADLAAALDDVDGISASITATQNLTITSDSSDQQFAFADDTSGILAAMGLNTFFTGTTALGLGVSEDVAEDPAKFAASRNGIGVDTKNAEALVAYGSSAFAMYETLATQVAHGSADAGGLADGARAIEETFRGQKLAISGVSLDEEAVRLMAHQHSFQASARYIATLRELLEILVNL